nr:hypothetical protein [Solirubrobacterales bacterium]
GEDAARQQLRQGRVAAEEMLSQGGELTENLRQLSRSLNTNAERLLVDIAKAHRALVRRASAVDGGGDATAAPGRPVTERAERARPLPSSTGDAELGVPEFIPSDPPRRRGR